MRCVPLRPARYYQRDSKKGKLRSETGRRKAGLALKNCVDALKRRAVGLILTTGGARLARTASFQRRARLFIQPESGPQAFSGLQVPAVN